VGEPGTLAEGRRRATTLSCGALFSEASHHRNEAAVRPAPTA
jgi:hypothetical protein